MTIWVKANLNILEEDLDESEEEDEANGEEVSDDDDPIPFAHHNLDEILDQQETDEVPLDPGHEGHEGEEKNSTPSNTMELTLEPEQEESEDYYIEESGIRLPYDLRHSPRNFLEQPPAPPPNPDPQLVVEAETFDPLLLQPLTDRVMPSDLAASVAELKERGFKVILDWSNQANPASSNPALPHGVNAFAQANCLLFW